MICYNYNNSNRILKHFRTMTTTTPISYKLFLLPLCLFTVLILNDSLPKASSASVKDSNSTIRCDNPNNCTCPGDPVTARYSDPDDPSCDRYYLCHMGLAFLKYCDVRQAFHPEKRECLPRSSVAFELCPTAVQCDRNGYVPDIKDCTMYYMCFYRQAYHYGCKADHYYDREQQECVKDAKRAISCNKARSEVQPETLYPSKHDNKRMLTDSVESLPLEEEQAEAGNMVEKVENGKRESQAEVEGVFIPQNDLVKEMPDNVN